MNVSDLRSVPILHHAYLVSGSARTLEEEVLPVLAKRGVPTSGNPDVYSLSVSELDVDAAREISLFASLKPVGDAKYILVSMSRATVHAQNALLKAIEEAPGSTVFFFITEDAGNLLPTVRSRCVSVGSTDLKKDEAASKDAAAFLVNSYAARLSAVEKMTGYIAKTQDRAPSREFMRALLREARGKKLPAPALRDLLDAHRFLSMQGSSAKAVLSHLAVSLPRVS